MEQDKKYHKEVGPERFRSGPGGGIYMSTGTSSYRIKLDINNMLAERIGKEHGLTLEDIDRMQSEVERAHENILLGRKQGKLGFMELPHQQETVEMISETVSHLEGRYENFVVLGIGGSALGNIALQTALNDPYYNLRPGVRGKRPRLFVPDNADPVRFKSLLDHLDLEKTLFNVISKSGGTAETMSQFLIAREQVADKLGENRVREHFIATTSRERGYLREIAEKEEMPTFPIPGNVGGRFSVLSPVGLLSAAFTGIDIEKLLAGAREMDRRCSSSRLWDNPAYLSGTLQYLAYQQGKPLSVMMPYAHALKDFADWYRQLWAESLGKEVNRSGKTVNVGPTPIKALGATDQHSQVQLYMEGPHDKVITFLEVEDLGVDLQIPELYSDLSGVSYLGGHTLGELLRTEKRATELALTRRSRPNITVVLPEINEQTMGQLFYMFELETALAGELFDIDAFNQPGVELGKHYTYGVFGRPGFEDKGREYREYPAKDGKFIID